MFGQRVALPRVFLVVHAAQNVQPDIFAPGAQFQKSVKQGLDVLDGGQPHHGPDVHPSVFGFGRDGAEFFVVHPVRDHDALSRFAPHPDLDAAGAGEQARDPIRLPVNLFRQHVEEPRPSGLEIRGHPLGPDDLLLPLTGVDAVFREQDGAVVDAAAKACQQPAVPGADGVVAVRFGHLARHQPEHRQQHGADGVERIREGRVGVLLLAQLGEQRHKLPALQNGKRVGPLFVEQAEQHLPIRRPQPHQLPQGRTLFGREVHRRGTAVQPQRVVQKDFVHLGHIGGQLVDEFPAVGRFCPDDPEDEFVLRHRADAAVHPCGHAAVYIRIGPFQHQTDPHPSFLLSFHGHDGRVGPQQVEISGQVG